MNSHEAAKPQIPFGAGRWLDATRLADETSRSNSLISARAGVSAGQSKRTRTPPEAAKCVQQRAFGRCVSADEWRTHQLRSRVTVACECEKVKAKNMRLWSALQGAERHAKSLAPTADAEYRDCSCRGAEREAESHACKFTLASLPRELMPNPSLKRSANGRPPGPGLRDAVHFLSPGPGVLPSSPA